MKSRSIALLAVIVAVIASAVFFLWKRDVGEEVKPKVSLDEATRFRRLGPANLNAEFVLGKPMTEWEMGTFWLPFAGDIALPKRIERVKFPRADGSDAEVDVSVYYGATGQPVRLERTQRADWKRWWTKQDLEKNMTIRGELMRGVSPDLLPKGEPWNIIFEYLRGKVDFESSVHFDATWVDYTYGVNAGSWYIINDFGDPALCPPDSPETDKQRIRIFPGEKVLRMDSTL